MSIIITDGTGIHIKRNVPSKRIKALHRKYGTGTSLRTFARRCAKHEKVLAGSAGSAGSAVVPDGVSRTAAKEWLAGKGIWS